MVQKWYLPTICLFVAIFMASCSRSDNNAQGYIEGRYTYMATPVSGVLKQLLVSRGSKVKQGQTLFTLDQRPQSDAYRAALESFHQSISARDQVIADLAYAKLTFERNKVLVPKRAIEQSSLDNARAKYESTVAQLAGANANIAVAEATLAEADWTQQQKIVNAPVDAIVFDTYYRIGEYTEEGKAILSLLAPQDIKVIFYISERDLGGIQLNDKVTVRCDSCQKTYPGRVSFISPSAEYTPPVIFSTETNAKLVYRIEAEFLPQDAYHLHPGQPVYVTYPHHG